MDVENLYFGQEAYKLKKAWVLTLSILIILGLASCANTSPTNKPYVFNGETNLVVDDRSFILEDIPENIAEDIVVKDFLYNITAEFDKKYEILADIESHSISIENQKKNFEDGCYMLSYIIHEIATLTEEQYNDEENPLYYSGVKSRVDEYSLVEYEIINADFSQIHSAKLNEMGPQWGDGAHNRSFIVGKSSDDDSYKIYDFGMM